MFWVGLFAFIIGFLGMLALLEWVLLRFVEPGTHWWEILHYSVNAIIISVVFGGGGFAVLSVKVLSWYHYKRGVYRCRFCGRPLKGIGVPCECPEAQILRK
jgi:hypothetical protein